MVVLRDISEKAEEQEKAFAIEIEDGDSNNLVHTIIKRSKDDRQD